MTITNGTENNKTEHRVTFSFNDHSNQSLLCGNPLPTSKTSLFFSFTEYRLFEPSIGLMVAQARFDVLQLSLKKTKLWSPFIADCLPQF